MRQATFSNAAAPGMARHISRADLSKWLLLHMASRGRGAERLSAGFTLIELMVVIVIVGILSAIAIPNFLNQTQKAKATEAKTSIAATVKQAQAQFMEDGIDPRVNIADMHIAYKTPLDDTTKFNYTAGWEPGDVTPNGIYTITATGNDTDKAITGKTIVGCVQFGSGVVKIKSNFDEADPICPTE